ncbi:MAG: hypothetical protein JSV18_05970 [Candidatus Bathyarchaeota archaeon]|nr:MAG: hypothetical protein JSV18_05970 [Candidatus Bathyarchaeota archaeon]
MAYHNLRDGDAVVTRHGLVFYVFGYQHPSDRYHGFLKYVPRELADGFDLDWVDITWEMGGTTLVRPRELYSPQVYQRLIEAFGEALPEYLDFSEQLQRLMIIIPKGLITRVYKPSRQLMLLKRRGPRDSLEEKALALLELLSDRAGIPPGFLGVHGSISLGIHQEGSDIDLTVYGVSNYRKAKKTLRELEQKGRIKLKRRDRIEAKRLNRGDFRGEDFIVNATRRFQEIDPEPRTYCPLGSVEVECRCVSARESMFRPAVYGVDECSAISGRDLRIPEISEVVSMIGMYRDAVREGERMRARGILEEVSTQTRRWLRVVVGASYSGEYLDWLRF